MTVNRYNRVFCFLAISLAVFGGCSSKTSVEQSKKTNTPPHKIQGKAQLLPKTGADAALSAGEASVYLWVGTRRYRLFLRKDADLANGSEYVAEGVNAQKVIDELGDPDQGKNGYPLASSCERVVKMAWSNQPMDAIEAEAQVLRTAVKRYPARPVFLVMRIRPATPEESSAASAERKKEAAEDEEDMPEVAAAADKQRALLIQSPPTQIAPLWEPAAGTVRCKVTINPEGKISGLETGLQLCESVEWSEYRYKPVVQRGHPVRVRTEVEVHFEPRK
jgi:hypothetical protein